ncbi:MAG: chromate transporter [Anaerolineaceae bacterium]|nr:MAG: chromate transporter [Anaerolineaceae bacterium]
MKKNLNLYWTLFSSTFLLSAFTFGGGYVIVPLMKKKFVDQLRWIEEEEMLNMIAIAQSSPGALAVNASIMVGYKIAGVWGAIISSFGTILPPLIILTVISFFYHEFRDNRYIRAMLKGMQAGVAAVITDVVLGLSGNVIKKRQVLSMAIMVAAFIAVFFFDINVAFVILISGLIGALAILLTQEEHS